MSKEGYFYVIQSGNSKLFKLGKSESPKLRLATLQAGNPEELKLIFSFNTEYSEYLEKIWHLEFSSKFVRGEWFILNEGDLKKILSETVRFDDFDWLVENYPKIYVLYKKLRYKAGENIPSPMGLYYKRNPFCYEDKERQKRTMDKQREWEIYWKSHSFELKDRPLDFRLID